MPHVGVRATNIDGTLEKSADIHEAQRKEKDEERNTSVLILLRGPACEPPHWPEHDLQNK